MQDFFYLKNIYFFIERYLFFCLILNAIVRIFISNRKNVSYIISWLLFIYCFPLFGIIFYFMNENINFRIKKKNKNCINSNFIHFDKNNRFFYKEEDKISCFLFQLCKFKKIGYLKHNQIKLLSHEDNIFHSVIYDINLAKNTIEMVFYIWKVGGLVDKVMYALIAASKRGVKCRLILDDFGSIGFFRSNYYKLMKKSEIKVIKSMKISVFKFFFSRLDHRQHKKMILIDKHIAYVGSMNMIDSTRQKSSVGKWIDIMVRIDGPIVNIMNIIFESDWNMENRNNIKRKDQFSKKVNKKFFNHTIQIIESIPNKNIIHQVFLISIYLAKKQLIITTPYLIPSNELVNAICTTANRGVEVHIILPKNNNSLLVHWASRTFFSELLESGVLIHQFFGGLLHTKSILVDRKFSIVGTANFDVRSLWLNFEIILVINDKNFGKNLFYIQRQYINKSFTLNLEQWKNRTFLEKILEKLFYLLSPFL